MSALIAKAAAFLAAVFIGFAAPDAAVRPPKAEAQACDASILQRAMNVLDRRAGGVELDVRFGQRRDNARGDFRRGLERGET